MSTLVRATNGQFVAQSFQQKYPTGRKHCGRCKHWRHVIDFSPAAWLDAAKTIPLKLISYCHACQSARARQRTGHSLRKVFDGQPGTPAWRQKRLAKKRQLYRRQRQDPVWMQARRDYANARNRRLAYAKWAPDPALSAKASGGESFRAAQFVAYIDQWLVGYGHEEGGGEQFHVNGVSLTETESRALRRWRNGEAKTVRLVTADNWAVRFDLPFWEIEEAAIA